MRALGGGKNPRPSERRVALRDMKRRAEPKIEGWFNRLSDGRVEVFLKATNLKGIPETKIRASGSEDAINQVADWFEETTGLRVNATWRVRKVNPPPGQTSLELSSGATLAGDDASL